jgi:hypothetical protein
VCGICPVKIEGLSCYVVAGGDTRLSSSAPARAGGARGSQPSLGSDEGPRARLDSDVGPSLSAAGSQTLSEHYCHTRLHLPALVHLPHILSHIVNTPFLASTSSFPSFHIHVHRFSSRKLFLTPHHVSILAQTIPV